MDVTDLRTFLDVVEHNGFRRAAQATFVSQPVVTRRVERLEQSLGVTLLERGPWGLRLTGHGRTLVTSGQRVLRAVDEARAATVGATGSTIRLGCSATAAGSYLARFLSDWIPHHPTTRVTMIEDGASRMRRRLEDDECDAAIVAAPGPERFASLPITTVVVQAVLPAQHPLAREEGPLDVAHLHGEPLLLSGRSYLSSELPLSACRLQAVEPDVVYECTVGRRWPRWPRSASASPSSATTSTGAGSTCRPGRCATATATCCASTSRSRGVRTRPRRSSPRSPRTSRFTRTWRRRQPSGHAGDDVDDDGRRSCTTVRTASSRTAGRSAAEVTGPRPSTPIDRAIWAKSTAGSSIAVPTPAFAVSRPRSVAIRPACATELLYARLLSITTSSGTRWCAAVHSAPGVIRKSPSDWMSTTRRSSSRWARAAPIAAPMP